MDGRSQEMENGTLIGQHLEYFLSQVKWLLSSAGQHDKWYLLF